MEAYEGEDGPYSNMSDVYGYGVVLFELASGSLPYTDINNKDQVPLLSSQLPPDHPARLPPFQILFMVGRGFLKPDMTKLRAVTPRGMRSLIEACISLQREARPDFKTVRGR